MTITSQVVGKVQVVAVSGRIDHANAGPLELALVPFLAACKADGQPLLLDFSQVDYISSVGLRVLMLAAQQAKAQKGQVAVAALTEVVKVVFEVSRFNMVLRVFASVQQGVEALSA